MVKWKHLWVLLLFLLANNARAFQEQENKNSIYVSSISWHTGIIIPAASFPDTLWREGNNYSDAQYLEIGWGDSDFFTEKKFNLWYALKAVFWPTPSVIQIKPIHVNVENYYTNTCVAKLEVNNEELNELVSYVMEELELDEEGKIIPVTEVFGNDFYKSSSLYYFPKNSNVWAARALKKAGFSIRPFWYQTTGQVVRKAGRIGEIIVKE